MSRLVSGCRTVDAKADSVKLLAVAVEGSDLTVVVEAPVETAVLLVPQDVAQKIQAMLDDGQILLFQIRPPHHDLRCDPGHTSLEHGKLSFTLCGLPVAREVGIESSVLIVDTSREPDSQDVAAQHGLSLAGELQVGRFRGRGINNRLRFASRWRCLRRCCLRTIRCCDDQHRGHQQLRPRARHGNPLVMKFARERDLEPSVRSTYLVSTTLFQYAWWP